MSYNEEPKATGGKIWKGFAALIFASQIAFSVILFIEIILLGMIPDKYLYAIGIVLWLLLMVNALLLFVGMKRPLSVSIVLRRLLAFSLAVLICFLSLSGYRAMDRVKKTLDEVTSTKTVTEEAPVATMNLYVFDEDPAKTVTDCKNYLTGFATGDSGRCSKAALNTMSAETGTAVRAKEYGSEGDLLTALYEDEVQAIIINSNQAEILSETEEYQDLIDGLRLIKEYDVTTSDLAFIPTEPDEKNDNETSSIEETSAVLDGITRTPFIVYISGSDTRNKKFKTSRSDVNILMVVNPVTKQILLLNTPRDYYIPNPKSSSGEKDKLTHLGLYGVSCSMKGLANLYGCTVNYSAQINFTGLETLVDQLGGVTINNPQAFTSKGGVKFKKGTITLNGEQALAYVRERYAFSSGDNMRGQNQMRVLTAMINKMTSSKSQVLKNYSGILKALSGMFKTSMSSEDIEKLVKMQLGDLAEWKITSYAVTGKNGSEKTYSSPNHKAYVMIPDDKSVAEASFKIKKVLAGEKI